MIADKANEVKWHKNRIKQYRQNKLFRKNIGKFYVQLDKEGDEKKPEPETQDATQFWNDIWGNPTEHKGMLVDSRRS